MAESNLALAPKVQARSIMPSRMRLAQYDRRDWVVNAEIGTSLDEVLRPEYWAHMAGTMSPYDHIEVRVDDEQWLAHLLVRRVERSAVVVHVLHFYELDPKQVASASAAQHRIEFKGPQRKHSVIRTSDNAVIRDEFASKEAARQWLTDYERTTG